MKRKLERKDRKLKKAKAFLDLVKSDSSVSMSGGETSFGCHNQTMERLKEDKIKHNAEEINLTENENQMNSFSVCEEKFDDGVESNKKYSTEVFNEMKKILRERNKLAMQRPKVFLTPDEMLPFKPSPEESSTIMPPLYAIDVQNLLLYALQGNTCSFKPRWCKLLRVMKVSSVVFIYLDGIGYTDFIEDKESFPFIYQTFDTHLEMICPEQYDSTVEKEIYSVALSISQIKKANVKVQEDVRKEVAEKIKPVSVKKVPSDNLVSTDEDKVTRVCLLLSSHQMKQEGYPLPVMMDQNPYEDFVFTKDHYTEVTSRSPLFAIDCEMCRTTARKNELTRVSIVAENGETIYDTLVKPRNRIIDYLTKYSGITKEMMEDVTVTLEDVQKDFNELLPSDAILCGQSLNCDLLALKLFHPYVIDTSVIYNMSGNRRTKAGLRKLTGFFLNRTIQSNDRIGHCSVEDAKATLDLVKLKLKMGLEFGDATISGVYFPNIHTYFLGQEGGKNNAIQNVEQGDGNLHSHTNDITSSTQTTSKSSASPLKRPCPNNTNVVDVKRLKASHNESKLTTGSSQCSWVNSQNQVAIFNQHNSVHVSQSFFKLVNEAGRAGCLIGREPFISKYGKEPVEKYTVYSDKEACKAAKAAVETKEFTWVNFNKYQLALALVNPEDSQESLKAAKSKLDKRVSRVMGSVKDKSLVVVVMGGRRTDCNIVNAGTFVKIT